MVLFGKSLSTTRLLNAYRAFSTTNSNSFAYLIKTIPRPSPKVPHPEHAKSNLKTKPLSHYLISSNTHFLSFQIKVSIYGETYFSCAHYQHLHLSM